MPYTESPLRNVELQSEVRPRRTRALRAAAKSDDISRRNAGSALQNTIYNALGSSEPVDLLPHISKRAALLHRTRTITPLEKDLRPSTVEDAAAETTPTDSTQPPMQEGLRVYKSPHSGAWLLDEVLYATPPGCRAKRTIQAPEE